METNYLPSYHDETESRAHSGLLIYECHLCSGLKMIEQMYHVCAVENHASCVSPGA